VIAIASHAASVWDSIIARMLSVSVEAIDFEGFICFVISADSVSVIIGARKWPTAFG